MPEVPWIGLLALAAMFVLPFVPDWIFEGPRTIRHRPRRQLCGDCGAPWTGDHACRSRPDLRSEVIRGTLQRLLQGALKAGRPQSSPGDATSPDRIRRSVRQPRTLPTRWN